MALRLSVEEPDAGNLIPRVPGGTYLDALPTWSDSVVLIPPIDGPNSALFPGVPWLHTFSIPRAGRYALVFEFAQNNEGVGGLRLSMAGMTYDYGVDTFYGFTRGAVRRFFLPTGLQVLSSLFLGDNRSGHIGLLGLFGEPTPVRLTVSAGQSARLAVPV